MSLPAELREYLGHLLLERGLSDNTLQAYRRDLDRYRLFLTAREVTSVAEVDPAVVSAYVVAIRTGSDGAVALTASSAARAASAVRGWHRFALAQGRGHIDPSALVRPPVPPRRLPKALTVDQVADMLTFAGRGEGAAALRDVALLETLYGSGARISEVVSLDVDDVYGASAQDDLIRLQGKGSKERIVPMGRSAKVAVQNYLVRARPTLALTGRAGAALFLNARGTRMSRQSAWAILHQTARRAGITQAVSPHTLRHSFATHLMQGGADVRVVQELLGHASVATTQIYTMVTIDSLREVYAGSHPRARVVSLRVSGDG